ncbi:DUF4349 domain-containing protein [Alteribacillus sp. HJP-4]|uniref:DUF4349 domain-containing protein n=1 Tax=Alteribacillus sp. HJP-4 TaxID=2775394 RepID=UPI0035CCF09F
MDSGNESGVEEESVEGSAGADQRVENDSPTDENRNSGTEALEEVDAADRMIIYEGNMRIEVENYGNAQRRIEQHIEEMDGYIVESNVQEEKEEEPKGLLTVRIPQEHFSSFLNVVEKVGTKVLDRSTNGNDVTEEYVDLEAQLRSQETVEERLLSFLEKAETTEDLLAISDDLSVTQQEIEQLKGRINYLENHVDYSTITIEMKENAGSAVAKKDSLQTWREAQNLFKDTINAILTFFSQIAIFFIGLSPVLFPLFVFWQEQ